jgi:hypothetical protein
MMTMVAAGRPQADEYAPYYEAYIAKVTGDDPVAALATQTPQIESLWSRVDVTRAKHRYAPGKWSVQEVIGHITDAERVFAFRALWFARADASALPGFDENTWMPVASFDAQPLSDVVHAWRAQRNATLTLLTSFTAEAWTRRGTANGKVMSVRALAFVIGGHEAHHAGVLRERYGLA